MNLDVAALPYEDVQLDSNVRLVSLPEWILAGIPVTCAFNGEVTGRIYAAVRCGGDPYADIHEWLAAQGLESDQRAESIEVYNFADPSWPAQTDVLIPVKLK
jgi:hypothetical protein